jgi:hypothetical protein
MSLQRFPSLINGGVGRLSATASVPGANWYDGAFAAFQSKGAASLAASYVNLANPGVNDLAVGSAPNFDAATGWGFTGTQYLITDFIHLQEWTVFVRFSDAVANQGVLFSGRDVSNIPRMAHRLQSATDFRFYTAGTTATSINPAPVFGVTAQALNKGYLNGSPIATLTLGNNTALTLVSYIGASNIAGSPGKPLTGKIQAIGWWNSTLTDAEIATISAAMAAL